MTLRIEAKGSESRLSRGVAAWLGLFALLLPQLSSAQTVVSPFDSVYSLLALGNPAGVPASLAGLTFKAGDPNTLLVGGSANGAAGKIYAIQVVRGTGNHITGFTGSASFFANAPEIDGGLAYGPNGVLFYTGYSENLLGQIKSGSTAPDRVINLDNLGVGDSVGTLNFMPPNSPGEGSLKIVSYSTSEWYDATLTDDGNGTFDVAVNLEVTLADVGPEGLAYVPNGSPLFPQPTMLVSEYDNDAIAAYRVDGNGDALPATRQVVVDGLSGAEGATVDPLTGDYLFSSFGTPGGVFVLSGFVAPGQPLPPAPSAAPAMSSLMLLLLATCLAVVGVASARRIAAHQV